MFVLFFVFFQLSMFDHSMFGYLYLIHFSVDGIVFVEVGRI